MNWTAHGSAQRGTWCWEGGEVQQKKACIYDSSNGTSRVIWTARVLTGTTADEDADRRRHWKFTGHSVPVE